jgi:hypothetical protein
MRRTALLVVLAAGVVAASSSAASATAPQPVTINVTRGPAGDFWSASGAFTDSGTMTDTPTPSAPTRIGTYHVFRTWIGADGTWTARADVKIVATGEPGVFDVAGTWVAISGTGEYAALHGSGTAHEVFDANAGTVIGTWVGAAHFD